MSLALIALSLTTALTGAPADRIGEAVEVLSTCDDLRRRECLLAAGTLGQLGDEVIRPIARRLHQMPRAGQLLALSVIHGRRSRAATEALMALAVDRRVAPAVRALAVDDLRGRAHNRLNDRLLRALRDPAPVVRAAAARVLGSRLYSGDRRIVRALIAAARDPDPAVRVEALYGCGFSADPATGPTLTRALTDPAVEVRRAAAEGLGLVSYPPAVDALITALSDRDPLVVQAAARALAHQTGADLGDDRSRWERWRAERRR